MPYLLSFQQALDATESVNEETDGSIAWRALFGVEQLIDAIYNQSIYRGALRTSRALALQLLTTIKAYTDKVDFTLKLTAVELWKFRNDRDQFRTAFTAELGTLPTFFVTQKEGFDTVSLLEWGENLFPQTLSQKVPEALFDARSACKALAFELGTASGFHIFRVTEAVLRRYYSEVSGGKAAPKVRTIGIYTRAMRDGKVGDPMVIAALEQIRDLHRNPLIHPEAVLTTDEAVSVLGIARSVIGAMLKALPDTPVTTSTPATQIAGPA